MLALLLLAAGAARIAGPCLSPRKPHDARASLPAAAGQAVFDGRSPAATANAAVSRIAAGGTMAGGSAAGAGPRLAQRPIERVRLGQRLAGGRARTILVA